MDPKDNFLDTENAKWGQIFGDGTSTKPGARCWHSLELTTDKSKLFMFGGFDGKVDLNELWRYDFGSATFFLWKGEDAFYLTFAKLFSASYQWKLVKPNLKVPSPRDRHTMVCVCVCVCVSRKACANLFN